MKTNRRLVFGVRGLVWPSKRMILTDGQFEEEEEKKKKGGTRQSFCTTVAVDEIGQVKIEFSDGDVDVIRIDAESRMEAIGRLF